MSSQSINYSCALPCCSSSVEQTDGLCGARLLALVLGIISLVIGILILSGIPSLHTLGTAAGGVFVGTGFILICIGLCLNCGPKKTQESFLSQVRDDYLRQQQALMNIEQSTINLLHELQNDLRTPQTHNRKLPPVVMAALDDFVAITSSDIPRLDAAQNNPLHPTIPQIPPATGSSAPTFSALSSDEQIKITQRILRVGELTNLLEDAIKAGQSTEAIEKQLIQEGIDPEAVTQKIATFKLKLSNQ